MLARSILEEKSSNRKSSIGSYWITTFGCQMNKADSERMAGTLEKMGYSRALDEFKAVPKSAITGERVLPSVFMPPLYFFFIYLIKIIFEDFLNYINLIIFAQIFFRC